MGTAVAVRCGRCGTKRMVGLFDAFGVCACGHTSVEVPIVRPRAPEGTKMKPGFFNCKHCVAYEPDPRRGGTGECRRRPPAIGDSYNDLDQFPLVYAGSWCLEFRPAPEPAEPHEFGGEDG